MATTTTRSPRSLSSTTRNQRNHSSGYRFAAFFGFVVFTTDCFFVVFEANLFVVFGLTAAAFVVGFGEPSTFVDTAAERTGNVIGDATATSELFTALTAFVVGADATGTVRAPTIVVAGEELTTTLTRVAVPPTIVVVVPFGVVVTSGVTFGGVTEVKSMLVIEGNGIEGIEGAGRSGGGSGMV
jgi:hypothetical protein